MWTSPSTTSARSGTPAPSSWGRYDPEPLGDYFAGPNHTLPTMGTARFYSPLSVDDFVKEVPVQLLHPGRPGAGTTGRWGLFARQGGPGRPTPGRWRSGLKGGESSDRGDRLWSGKPVLR
ncbi:MAG: histidinol dehydrogenase [Lawsonibacter sp.]